MESPGKCGIPMPHSQPCKANRLASLHRTGCASQSPFSSPAFRSAWEGTHCQSENEISGSVNVRQGLWCWKYYLWKKHYLETELKAPRFWEEYQSSGSECIYTHTHTHMFVCIYIYMYVYIYFPYCRFLCFPKSDLAWYLLEHSQTALPHHHYSSLFISSLMMDREPPSSADHPSVLSAVLSSFFAFFNNLC